VICPTSQAKRLRRIGTTGKSGAFAEEPKVRMSMINRIAIAGQHCSKGYYFRGFPHRGATQESRAYRVMTGTARRSSAIFLLQTLKNTGKTGVSDKKTQKTPRKTV
jgi:hypothetical protein